MSSTRKIFHSPQHLEVKKVWMNLITAGRVWCPHHSTCIHIIKKYPGTFPKYWSKKAKGTRKMTLYESPIKLNYVDETVWWDRVTSKESLQSLRKLKLQTVHHISVSYLKVVGIHKQCSMAVGLTSLGFILGGEGTILKHVEECSMC